MNLARWLIFEMGFRADLLGTVFAQQGPHLKGFCQLERREPAPVDRIDLCAVGQEQLRYLQVVPSCRNVQGRLAPPARSPATFCLAPTVQ